MSEIFTHTLSTPLVEAKGADFEKYYELTFKAPSYNDREQATRLSQAATRALFDMMGSPLFKGASAKRKGDGSDKVDGSDKDDAMDAKTVRIILMGSDQDFNEIRDMFIDLACRVGEIDEGNSLTRMMFSRLELEEVDMMCCGYIAFFIMPSVLSEMN